MYRRDESKMHTASALVIVLNALAWAVLLIGIIFVVLTSYKVAGAVILGFVAFWYIFSERYFNYYEGVQIEFKPNSFEYEYRLNSDIVGSGKKVVITARNVTKVRICGRKAVVYGDITKKAPFKKISTLKRVRIMIDFGNDREILVTKLNELERRVTSA